MIYLFDKTQTLTGVIDEHTETLSATLEMKINEASTLDFSLPLDDDLSEKMAGVKYVGVPSPNSADKIVFLRLMTINDETDRVEYMAKELAYQELSSIGYIEDKRPVESDAQTLMNIALDGSGYKLGVVNVPGKVKTNFYYTDHLSAISNVLELLGGEIYFYVSITGSKITGRYMDYVAEQGTNTSKTFADGSNLITVERKRDMSSVYTAILPRGKGEQVSDGEGDTPDGYGRRINIAGITWSKSNGNPLDKAAGDKILVDQDATSEYGNADGTPRLLLKTYDDIEDENILINKAYMDLMTMNKPAVQYSATVANVGDMQLGDTIVIMHSKRSMSYRTRVFHITYDLIDNTKTVAEFGNDLSKDSITNQINSISSNGANISDQVQWNISNGGHNNTSYGAQEPANPRKGDVWFKQLPNGNTEEYYFDGTVWVLGAKTDQQWQENQAIAQGTHTTFYGPATPIGAVKGDVWFKNDNNVPDGRSMYTYDGSNWIKFEGSADASRLQIGTIDASKINVMNVSASNITTGNLSADFLKGGQIDGNQINVININAQNIVGKNASFVKASWDDAYDHAITIDPTAITLYADKGKPQEQTLKIGGGVIAFHYNESAYDNTYLSNGAISMFKNGNNLMRVGAGSYGFSLPDHPTQDVTGIAIGAGQYNPADAMAFGISMNQRAGSAPQLVWAGSETGRIITPYRVWENPAGWIMPDNIRFSTWDDTASTVWFDNTVNVNIQAADFRITHFNDNGVYAHKWQGKIGDSQAIGMTTGDRQAGWAVTGDDTWLFVHGQPYSAYRILNKLGMI